MQHVCNKIFSFSQVCLWSHCVWIRHPCTSAMSVSRAYRQRKFWAMSILQSIALTTLLVFNVLNKSKTNKLFLKCWSVMVYVFCCRTTQTLMTWVSPGPPIWTWKRFCGIDWNRKGLKVSFEPCRLVWSSYFKYQMLLLNY